MRKHIAEKVFDGLADVAAKTKNPYDDFVVDFLRDIVINKDDES